MLLPRVLTALVGIPVLLYLAHAGGLAFAVLMTGVGGLCSYEYALALKLGGRPVQPIPTILAGTGLAACAAFGGPSAAAFSLAAALIVLVEVFSKVHSLDRAALSLFGATVAGWMPAHLALIRDIRPHGQAYLFLTLVAVWCTDTAAYAAGSMLGRRKLAPALSPKKTWEGAAAGFAAAVAVGLAFQHFALQGALSPLQAAGLGAVIAVTGQLADLSESMIKRDAGVKDSGALLPGHGGVFDRFDSFILCAPAVYYLLTLK
jgi:phosphatidate cytidylyltransferase